MVILIRFVCDCWRQITICKRLNFRYDFFASLQSKFLQIILTIKYRWLSPIVTFKVHPANWKQLDQKTNKFQSRLSRTINPKNYHLHWIEHQTNGCLILIAIECERKRDEFFFEYSANVITVCQSAIQSAVIIIVKVVIYVFNSNSIWFTYRWLTSNVRILIVVLSICWYSTRHRNRDNRNRWNFEL